MAEPLTENNVPGDQDQEISRLLEPIDETGMQGRIKSIQGNTVIVQTEGGKEYTFRLDQAAKIHIEGKTATVSDLKAGSRVRLTTKTGEPGTIMKIEARGKDEDDDKGTKKPKEGGSTKPTDLKPKEGGSTKPTDLRSKPGEGEKTTAETEKTVEIKAKTGGNEKGKKETRSDGGADEKGKKNDKKSGDDDKGRDKAKKGDDNKKDGEKSRGD